MANLGIHRDPSQTHNHLSSTITPLALLLLLSTQGALAQDGVATSPDLKVSRAAIARYWTPERMRNAIPSSFPKASLALIRGKDTPTAKEETVDAVPSFAPGWAPDSGNPQPASEALLELVPQSAMHSGLSRAFTAKTTPLFTAPTTPTDYKNYAPFNRWTWDGDYRTFPVSTIGKLFFSQNGLNYVCSASVIHKSTLATAGHCVHAGGGGAAGWSTNIIFCPGYNADGPDPVYGCWAGRSLATSSQWLNSRNVDRDYGCIVTETTGTTQADSIGNVTGWLGRAVNLPSKQSIFAWGYPAGAPFSGNRIIAVVSTEWYQLNMNTSEAQLSKYIGSDMTGGASGGPWWINMVNHDAALEIADTDGSSITDPEQGLGGAPLLNGVNSHKRCAGNCTSGLFKEEMGSPQFRNTAADTGESEDVFTACFAKGGAQ